MKISNERRLAMREEKDLGNYNFLYSEGSDYSYSTEYNCEVYGCDYICRCGNIYDAEITQIPNLESFVKSNFKGSDLQLYCIERIYAINGFHHKENWKVETCGGYYGEEIAGIFFDNAEKAFDEVQMLSLMKDSGKIEHVLELEYGRKLDSVLNKTWEIDYVSFDDLFFGAEYHKTNKKIVDCYANREFPKAIVLRDQDKYRVVDGYHRLATGTSDGMVLVVIGS